MKEGDVGSFKKPNQPKLQDQEPKYKLQSDDHHRCLICNYSNLGYHDIDLISLNGPLSNRQMFMDKNTHNEYCECCVGSEFSFGGFGEFNIKSDLIPLKRPFGNADIAVFDNTEFARRMGEEDLMNYDYDHEYEYLEENFDKYDLGDWDEIIEADGFKIDEELDAEQASKPTKKTPFTLTKGRNNNKKET